MANTTISIRSSGDTGVTPSLGVLANGELALNFADGILYYKTASNTLGTITTTEPAGLNKELQFNDSGSFGSNAGLTFDKTTGTFTVPSLNVATVYSLPTTDGTNGQILTTDGSGTITFQDPATPPANVSISTFNGTGDGSTVTYNLGFRPQSKEALLATIGGVLQDPSTAFTVNQTNNTITFTSAPTANAPISIISLYTNVTPIGPADVIVSNFITTANGVVDTFDLGFNVTSANNLTVAVDGVLQTPTLHYTVNTTANTITFDSIPPNSSNISVVSLYTNVNTYADVVGTAAFAHANGAFDAANSATTLAQNAYDYANTIVSDTQVDPYARAHANGAFDTANTNAGNISTNTTNITSAYNHANGAFTAANTAQTTADGAQTHAEGAFTQANTNASNITTAQNTADGAFVAANTAQTTADAAYGQANTATTDASNAQTHAEGAFTQANTNAGNISTTNSRLDSAFGHANAAYTQANTATSDASAAQTHAEGAFTQANTNASNITTAQNTADGAYNHANGAFALANTAITTSGGTITGNLTVTQNISAGNISLTGTANIPSLITSDTLTIGSQVIYTQGTNGFSVNEDFDPSANSTQTAYHFTSGAGRETVAFTLARTAQFTDGFGIYGTSSDNKFVMFGEQTNTSWEWRKGVGIQPLDLDGGTLVANLSSTGNLTTLGTISAPGFFDDGVDVKGHAEAAFTKANTNATNITTAQNTADGAYTHANGAFDAANTKFASAGGAISGDVSITGNLTVVGQTVYANTTTALIADNILTVNAAIDQASAPASNAGLEVDRGSSANVSLLWNETDDKWTFTNDGSNYSPIADANRLDSSFTHANSAYDTANTNASNITTAQNTADGAYSHANGAFTAANTAQTTADGAQTHAEGAFTQANTNASNITTAQNHANGAFDHANGAFTAANTASTSDYTNVSVTPGTYGSSSAIPQVTVEANGRISAVTTQAFSAATVGDILALSIALG